MKLKHMLALVLALMLAMTAALAEGTTYTDKETVKQVQQALNDAGYNCGTPDGAAGKNTKKAISDFQAASGLEATGEIDDALLVALGLKAGEAVELDAVIGDGSDYTLTLHESALPFAQLQWGATPAEVLAAIGADGEAKGDIEAKLAVPGLAEPLPVRFHFAAGALASVSVTAESGVRTAGKFQETEAGKQLLACLLSYYAEDAGDNRLVLTSDQNHGIKSTVTDAIVGYIREGDTFRLGAELTPPAAFDETLYRSGSDYTSTIADGTTNYFVNMNRMTIFRTQYSKNERYDQSSNVFTDKIEMLGSNVSVVNAIPRFFLSFAYGGLVDPTGIETFTFMIDGTMYQCSGFKHSKATVSQYRDYTQQFFIIIGECNAPLMEAIAATKGTVKVEIRGGNFLLSVDMPAKARKVLADDWVLFKKAGGAAPFYQRICGEVPMLVR